MSEMVIRLDCIKRWSRTIPFSMLNEEWADRNHGQTLKRLAERGGLSPCEAVAIIEKRKWAAMLLKDSLAMLEEKLSRK